MNSTIKNTGQSRHHLRLAGLKSLAAIVFVLLLTTAAQATSWRVNNKANTSADFTSLDSAQAAASAGDTLYIEGAVNSYGNFTLTKPLTLIGPGYFIAQNQPDTTRADLLNAKLGNMTINSGASGAVVMGLEMAGNAVNADSVHILRNKISHITVNSRTGVLIMQNYINNSSNSILIDLRGTCRNTVILNNILKAIYSNYWCMRLTTACVETIIQNNILYGRNTLYNAVLSYNILQAGSISGDALSFPNFTSNNMSDEADFGTTLGNLANVDMATVFIQSSQSPDKYYELKPDSPARDIGGVDMGAFGGADPYRLSGIVALPSIFEVQVNGNPASRLDVTFKAKANN